jgi:photoactive yellow protein
MEQELRRLREERNQLVLQVHELERKSRSDKRERPSGVALLPGAQTARRNTPLGLPALTGRKRRAPSPTTEFDGDVSPNDVVPTPVGSGAVPQGNVAAASQGLDFGAISKLSASELDDLPYGLITLDAEGRVVHYNDTEARLAGFPKERVIGRSFFEEVAPCTRVREFQGRFEDLVEDPHGVRVQTFDFVFRFDHSEQHVSIVMTPARRRGHYHLALLRRAIVAG